MSEGAPSLERACMVRTRAEMGDSMALALGAAEAAVLADPARKGTDGANSSKRPCKFTVVERPRGYRRDAQGR